MTRVPGPVASWTRRPARNEVTRQRLTGQVWHLLSTGQHFEDLGADYFQRRRDPERETQRLVRRLQQLGHMVTLTA